LRKVGVVGCGVISTAHLQGWRASENCAIAGVFDLNRELAERQARRFGVDRIFTNLDEVIDACDIVDICTPPQAHFEGAMAVIRAERDLFIEKPVVIRLDEWNELSDAMRGSKTRVSVMHHQKFTLSTQRARSWFDAGRIGRIVRFNRMFLTSPRKDRMFPESGHWSHALPGGRWFETLPHELYMAYHFVGPAELDAVSVVHTSSSPPGADADEVVITLRSAEAIVTFHYSANCDMDERTTTIYGAEGVIDIDGLSDVASLRRVARDKWVRPIGAPFVDAGSVLLRMPADRARYLRSRVAKQSPHVRAIVAFAEYLDGTAGCPTTLEEIDYVVRYSDAIGRAIDERLGAAREGP
jgi:predicted dehydrogenase